jgi:hypothetical protein
MLRSVSELPGLMSAVFDDRTGSPTFRPSGARM